jgi:hypothetical protein
MSFPAGTEMFQFPTFASHPYVFRVRYRLRGGLPHSDIHGSTPARGSPWLYAACHVLHRLLVPRHPPNALLSFKPDKVTPLFQAKSTLPTTRKGGNVITRHLTHRAVAPMNTLRPVADPYQQFPANRLSVRLATKPCRIMRPTQLSGAPTGAPEPDSHLQSTHPAA